MELIQGRAGVPGDHLMSCHVERMYHICHEIQDGYFPAPEMSIGSDLSALFGMAVSPV